MDNRPAFLSLGVAVFFAALALLLTVFTASAAEWQPMTASWYGAEVCSPGPSCRTASGALFDYRDPRIAAHKTLPFGAWLLVCHMEKCLVTQVLDRGPFVAGRDLDLSQAGFARLAPLSRGVLLVQVIVLEGGC